MLHLKFIRELPDIIKKDLKKRDDPEKIKWVDQILEQDKEQKKLQEEIEKLRQRRNNISEEINKARKEKKDIKKILEEAKTLPDKIKQLEEKSSILVEDIKNKQMRLPNILHESVPLGKSDEENVVVREVGKKRKIDFALLSHGEWLEKKDQAEFKKAAEISGTGFYYLKDKMALLDIALQRYAVDKLIKKGFTLIQPPTMMRKKPYEGVTDLDDFEKVMYKIEDEDLYLIATSEHPIAALYMNETLGQLPIKAVGLSTCYRREIGSHGIDTRGLFRVHEFHKVEQFVFCRPEESWTFHEELLQNAEEIFKELKLAYRVVNVCTGDIGIVAAKKYDIEAWMPREEKYREVVSCSNCTAYQAARLNIRYKKGEEKEFVHTLNATAIATSRAIRAIIENYQQKDGSVEIPKALIPYMNGIKKI